MLLLYIHSIRVQCWGEIIIVCLIFFGRARSVHIFVFCYAVLCSSELHTQSIFVWPFCHIWNNVFLFFMCGCVCVCVEHTNVSLWPNILLIPSQWCEWNTLSLIKCFLGATHVHFVYVCTCACELNRKAVFCTYSYICI